MATPRNGLTNAPTAHDSAPARAYTAPAAVSPKGRRRPGMFAGAVALTLLGAFVAVRLIASAGDRTEVVVLTRDVPYGSVITPEDLTGTDISIGARVATIPAGDASRLVGMVAATNLVVGSLLSPAQLTTARPPLHGQSLVALSLAADRLPASGLVAGDHLLVVDTPPADADPPQGPPHSIAVTVARVGPRDLNGVSVVDVVATATDGPALAARAATGRFALVLQAADATRATS